MHGLYVDEIYRVGVVILSLIVWVYRYSFLHSEILKKTIQGQVVLRSELFKVIEISTNRKPVCDLLLVFHRNCMPIFYRFLLQRLIGRKTAFLPFSSTSVS